MEKQQIFEDLENLPIKIKDKDQELLSTKSELDTIEQQLTAIVNVTRAVVTDKTDGLGKKIYTNELSRKKAINEQLSTNKGFIELTEKQKELKTALALGEIQYKYLSRKFRAAEAYARLGVE